MKRGTFILGGSIAVLLAIGFYFSLKPHLHSYFSSVSNQKSLNVASQNSQDAMRRLYQAYEKEKDNLQPEVVRVVKNLARKISQSTISPEYTSFQLDQVAKGLTEKELETIANFALNEDAKMDERFLAAFLLSRSKHDRALHESQRVVLAPMSRPQNRRSLDEEASLRAQIIEGIVKFGPSALVPLQEIFNKVENGFLRDRAKLSMAAIERQDPDLLRKLDKQAIKNIEKKMLQRK